MTNDGTTQRTYRQEIESALEVHTYQIGRVFRAMRDDGYKDAQSIADAWGIATYGGISQSIDAIESLIQCKRLTDSPTLAGRMAGLIRNFTKTHKNRLSPETIDRLAILEDEHDRVANNEEAIDREGEQLSQKTRDTEARQIPGIYVYSYQHYIRYPVNPSDEDDTRSRTYLKIGLSEKDVGERLKQQNITALPEPPILLRIYTHPNGNLKEIEDKMHKHLNAADHNQNRLPGSGTEWFLTHLTFIDSTAKLLGLNIVEPTRDEDEHSS